MSLVLCASVYAQNAKEIEEKQPMKYIRLNDGNQMPVLGFGTWTLYDQIAEEMVYEAIKKGYRLIDTARYYANEEAVGRGVRRAIQDHICHREDVFITSKIAPFASTDFDALIEESNANLGLDYIDLMLVHQSGMGDEALYQALVRALKKGIVKSIGISNYYTKADVERVTAKTGIVPSVIQNENHPYYQNTRLQADLKDQGVIIESYYPLGGRDHVREMLKNETIAQIAKNHEKSPAQIILRWHIQAGYVAIPGTANVQELQENLDIFDFALTDDEMRRIASLNTGKRYENW